MISYKAIQETLVTPVQGSLPINKLCDWLEALPNRPVLHFPLTCVGLACAVLRLQVVGVLRWLVDVAHRGEAWLCLSVCNIMCDLLPYCVLSFH